MNVTFFLSIQSLINQFCAQETKEELETAGSVAQSMKRMATGATADGCVWDVYSERINDIRMQRRENIDKLFLLPDFYLSDNDIDYVSMKFSH